MKEQKIQNGELVELSAAGRKMKQNAEVVGLWGMVMEYDPNNQHPYRIQWFGYTQGDGTFPMKEYEIKRVRA